MTTNHPGGGYYQHFTDVEVGDTETWSNMPSAIQRVRMWTQAHPTQKT